MNLYAIANRHTATGVKPTLITIPVIRETETLYITDSVSELQWRIHHRKNDQTLNLTPLAAWMNYHNRVSQLLTNIKHDLRDSNELLMVAQQEIDSLFMNSMTTADHALQCSR